MAKLSKMTFRNVRIRYIDLRRKAESAPFVRLHLVADLSTTIKESMGWEPGSGISSAGLAGLINADSIILTPPNQRKLPGVGVDVDEVQVTATDASDFKFVERKNKEGLPAGMELLCMVRSHDEAAAAKLEQFWRGVQGAAFTAQLRYSSIGIQAEIDNGEDAGAAEGEGDE